MFLMNPIAKYLAIALTVILILFGVYVKGRSDGRNLAEGAFAKERIEWQAKVDQASVKYQEQVQAMTNAYLAESSQYQEQIEWLKKHPRTVRVYIPLKSDATVPKGFVDLHDTAAKGLPLSDVEKPTAGDPSDKKLSDVATTVASNYYQCLDMRAQLVTLQNVIREFQKSQVELNK